MIFVLLFLVMTMFSFSADSLQHGMAWRSRPNSRLPHFSLGYHPGPADDVVCLARRDWADIYHSCKNDAAGLLKLMAANKQNEKMVIDDSIEGRSKNKFNSKNNGGKDASPMMDRSFGFKFLGFNALANYLINSVSYTTTSTSYSTTYSTLTIGKVTTCYTTDMFASTTPCRRKRESSSIKEKLKKINPSKVERVLPSFSGVDIMLLGEGNSFFDDIQRTLLIESSKHEASLVEENKAGRIVAPRKFGYGEEFLENLPGETVYVSSSIITSFSFYTTYFTSTFTTLDGGVGGVLSCLPDCFILC